MTSGIAIRQTSGQLIVRAALRTGAGAKVTSGTAELRLWELQDDGTLKHYDFDDDTFKTGTPTDDEVELTHRQVVDDAAAAYDTGVWTYALSTLSGFTEGNVYLAEITHGSAVPASLVQEFQFGGAEGDLFAKIEAARKGVTNKYEIDQDAKTKTLYEDDGATPYLVFDITTDDEGKLAGETPQ